MVLCLRNTLPVVSALVLPNNMLRRDRLKHRINNQPHLSGKPGHNGSNVDIALDLWKHSIYR